MTLKQDVKCICGHTFGDHKVVTNACAECTCELFETEPDASDPVNHPAHYTAHPSGVECIEITEHLNFCIGNAIKYLWRCDGKKDSLEDLKKARWYIDREIQRREAK